MKGNLRTLIDFLERALEVGADCIEVEYKDHREWIYARQGHIDKWSRVSAGTGAKGSPTTSKRAR